MSNVSQQIIQLKNEGYSYQQIGNIMNMSKEAVRGRYRRYKNEENCDNQQPLDSFNKTEDKNTLTINTKSTRIKTVEDALKYAEVDTNI
jgi:orotate phosphoribosyltransferase-like protein